jgi:hypothetical protein
VVKSAIVYSGKEIRMAIQFTDFSSKPLMESPAASIFENVLKGYKMSQEPGKMKQEATQRELANNLKKLEVEHKPKEYALGDQEKGLANALKSKALEHYEEKFGLERDLKKAQIQKALQQKVGGTPKANGELANYIVSHPDATQEDIRKAYEEIHGSKLAHEQAVTERSKDITTGTGFDKLPVDEKKRAVGLTTAMGIDPVEGTQLLRSGKTLEQIAKDKGQDLGDLVPVYPLGTENVKQLQRRSGYVAELKNLEQKVAKPLAKYPAKVRGYSLDQIADSLDNKNPDEMGQVLAARALSPEIAALRLKVAGGNIGIEAINELTNKSMGQMKIIEGLVDTPTYLATQKYITQWLEEAADTFQKNQEEYGRLKSKGHAGKTYDLGTRSWK